MPAGRPRKELDAEQVYKLARIGCTQADIADIFDVSVSTIKRNYATECSRAQGEFKTSLRRAQYLRAVKDKSDTMLIHMGKQYLGQSEKVESMTEEKRTLVVELPTKELHAEDQAPEGAADEVPGVDG